MAINYVKNDDLLKEIKYFKETGVYSERLGKMILDIANKLLNRWNFNRYPYKDDLISYGVEIVLRYLHNFDETRSKNAFSYITTNLFNAYVQIIKKENKERSFKYELQGIDNEFYEREGIFSMHLEVGDDEENIVQSLDDIEEKKERVLTTISKGEVL